MILALSLVLIISFSLFACNSGNGDETNESSETTSESASETTDSSDSESDTVSNSESESDTVESEESGTAECKHENVVYKNNASGRCEKSCADCNEVLETPRHTKGAPDPDDGCNIKCTKCGYVLAEGKHTVGDPDTSDGCKVKCTECGIVIGDAQHGDPDEDEWALDPERPQSESALCPDCGTKAYRDASTAPDGLVLFTPSKILELLNNKKIDCTVGTDDNGLRYLHTVANEPVEATITLNSGSEPLFGIGKYVAVMARKDGGEADLELWINAAGTGEFIVGGAKRLVNSVICDGKWHLLVFDFSDATQVDVEKGIGWARLDLNPPRAEGDALDIAFVGFFESIEDVDKYYKSYIDVYVGAEN